METTRQKIVQLRTELAATPMRLSDRERLDRRIRLEINYNSNHIEGNTLTYEETELLLIHGKTIGNHAYREYQEMQGHDMALMMVNEWARRTEWLLTEMEIRNLHQVMMVKPFWKEAITPGGQPTMRVIEVGSYKKYPNSVRLRSGGIFHYASPVETPIQMGELVAWFREQDGAGELDPVELAAMLHYLFVLIHPFDDGNGRLSRLLMNFVLQKHGLPPAVIKSRDKTGYLSALNQADAGNLDAFIEYIALQVIVGLELSIKRF